MRIALCSSSVPFVDGGYRNIVEWLATALRRAGHSVEIVYLPQDDSPVTILRQMAAFRWLDLDAADRVVCFRPQSHLVRHRHKIVWFIHHLRPFYDLWDTPYREFPADSYHLALRESLRSADTEALAEAKQVFANSAAVAERLRVYNGIDSEVLYPPLDAPERFGSTGANNEIVYVSRLEHHKRQHLLVEAMAHTKTPVRLRVAGASSNSAFPQALRDRARELGVGDRVEVEAGWMAEHRKIEVLGAALATAYVPFDEDSYGYASLESSYSSKAILTTSDSGGVLELVHHGHNGYVQEPSPESLAEGMDALYEQRERTETMGRNARAQLDLLNISWDWVVDRITA